MTVPETSPALSGLVLSRVKCLGNWDVDPTVPYATSQLRSSSVQRYRNIYVGKATAFMPRPLCPAGKNPSLCSWRIQGLTFLQV